MFCWEDKSYKIQSKIRKNLNKIKSWNESCEKESKGDTESVGDAESEEGVYDWENEDDGGH